MAIRINKSSFVHVDGPAPLAGTVLECRICGTVGPNPFRNEPDEPAYQVRDIRVKDCNGRDITGIVEGWEFERIYHELIEGYGDEMDAIQEARYQEQIETALLYA